MSEIEQVQLPQTVKRKLEDIFKCVVCNRTPPPPQTTVFECPDGHITCDQCLKQSSHCPRCNTHVDRNKSKRIRCLAVEQATEAANLVVSCRNEGCDFSGSVNDLQHHLSECVWRLVSFPFKHEYCRETAKGTPPAFRKLPLNKIVEHHGFESLQIHKTYGIKISHGSTLFTDNSQNCQALLVKKGNEHFIIMSQKIDGVLYNYVQIIGNDNLAQDFHLIIALGRDRLTRIAHRGKVLSIDTDVDVKNDEGIFLLAMDEIGKILLEPLPDRSYHTKLDIYYQIVEARFPILCQRCDKPLGEMDNSAFPDQCAY